MKKKLLILMLALALVLAFSSLALAADSFSVKADAGSGKAAAVSDGENAYVVYTDADSVKLTLTPKTGVTLNPESLTLSAGTTGTVTATDAEGVATEYTFTYKKVEVKIADALYGKADGTEEYEVNGKGKIVVPTNVVPYAKITVKDSDGNALDSSLYSLVGAEAQNDGGFARLLSFDDRTLETGAAVRIGGVTFASHRFTLLRPTLDRIKFNSKATNTGDRTLTVKSGVYDYDTKDQVDGAWSTVYFEVIPLCGEAGVTVEQGSKDMEPDGKGWYSQALVKDVYNLTVTVTLEDIEQKYTVHLMNDAYSGPQVTAFDAFEKDGGTGEKYLTLVDGANSSVYVFLPEGADKFYASVAMSGKVKNLKLDGTAVSEGEWYEEAASLDGKKLTYSDDAGKTYAYTVTVENSADKNDTDASLISLKVRSGSKASTSDNVELAFDPKTLDYAFPVAKSDAYLSITATASDSDATVFINGQKAASLTVDDLDTEAVTEFDILVVAGDNKTTKTYTVTVNGSAGLLNTLSASDIKGLTPGPFKSDIRTYTGYTDPGKVSTLITALAKNYSSDFVQISKAEFNSYGQAKSYTALTNAVQGGTSVTAALTQGSNIFRVDVLASATATSAKASYYLTVYVPAASPKCVVSSQKLYINGTAKTLSAYNIAGNNYLKLRDIAALLDGTVKEMKVDWDASTWTASMAMPGTFAKRGDELTTLTPPSKYALSTQYFTYNALPVYPLAYNVTGTGDDAGSNYVMLRDVASLLNFGVTYDGSNQSIHIDTASKYTPGL